MTENAYRQFDATTVDYERAYRETALVEGVVMERMPWDIGGPQPILVQLEGEGRIRGDVLDVGAGLGDNAIFIAERGYRATGVDISATAVRKQRDRAAARGVAVGFAVADATRLEGLEGQFDTVTSSLVFHGLTPARQREYADAVARALRPGGRLLQWCSRGDAAGPEPITEASVRAAFSGPEWTITELTAGHLATKAIAEDAHQVDYQGGKLASDETGAQVPIWLLDARRA